MNQTNPMEYEELSALVEILVDKYKKEVDGCSLDFIISDLIFSACNAFNHNIKFDYYLYTQFKHKMENENDQVAV